jgi:hypothetical protein
VRLHLVVPALNSHLHHWLSDTDAALSTARRRADEAQVVLAARRLTVSVEIVRQCPAAYDRGCPRRVRCR